MPLDMPVSHYECVTLQDNRLNIQYEVKQKSFKYMSQLEGWCSFNKAAILIDLVLMLEPNTLVEIGVFGGRSLIPMATALKATGKGKAFGIDPWDPIESAEGMDGVNYDWWGHLDHEKIYQGVKAKVEEFGLEETITLIRSTSELAPYIPNIDILHIDGNHSEKAAYFDVNKWVPLVKKGGLIIFDDVTWGTNKSAVEWLDETCVKLVEYHEGCDWGIWVKP